MLVNPLKSYFLDQWGKGLSKEGVWIFSISSSIFDNKFYEGPWDTTVNSLIQEDCFK